MGYRLKMTWNKLRIWLRLWRQGIESYLELQITEAQWSCLEPNAGHIRMDKIPGHPLLSEPQGNASKSSELSKIAQLLSVYSCLCSLACHSVFYFSLPSEKQLILSSPSFEAEYPLSEHDFPSQGYLVPYSTEPFSLSQFLVSCRDQKN